MFEAELILSVFIFINKKVVEDTLQCFFGTVEDEVRVAERVFKPVGGEPGRIIIGDGLAVVIVHIVKRQAALGEQRHQLRR